MNPVVIVGGGLSGLSAAVRLSSRRIPVLLLEQRTAPGGRAYSFVDEPTGTVIDNGQHVLIAGYTRTILGYAADGDLCNETGVGQATGHAMPAHVSTVYYADSNIFM